MIWNPGEGSDLNEGGDGTDTVEVNGGNGAESFTVTPNGTRVRFDRVTPAPFFIDIGTSENLVVNMLALAINLVFILGGLLLLGGFIAPPSDAGELSYRVLNFVSVPLHFSRDFSRGLIDTRHVVLYLSVTLTCLFLTTKSLESRRWR